jgi:hypothetical protein
MIAIPGRTSVPAALDMPVVPGTYSTAAVLAHGAGGDMNSGNMITWAKAFNAAGMPCLRFTIKPPNLNTRKICMEVRRLGISPWFPARDMSCRGGLWTIVACLQGVMKGAVETFPQLHDIKTWLVAGVSMVGRLCIVYISWHRVFQLEGTRKK